MPKPKLSDSEELNASRAFLGGVSVVGFKSR